MMESKDKAGKAHWEGIWNELSAPDPVNPRDLSVRNYINRRFHQEFMQALSGMQTEGARLLEVGCANSAWLPYFSREFGMKVAGLDYSTLGVEQERDVLARAGVDGEVFCADLFDPPAEALQAYDVIVSIGVAEHFEDTSQCIAAMARLLRPGGIMITIIPNIPGLVGTLTRIVNPYVFHIHVPLTAEQLKAAHEQAGMTTSRCDYFMGLNSGVANLAGLDKNRLSTRVKRVILAAMVRICMVVWWLEDRLGYLPPTRLFSPFLLCVAHAPAAPAGAASEPAGEAFR